MLTITIPGRELYDEEKNEFFTLDGATIQLEHSLVSLSKWEKIWEKPFLGKGEKTDEETKSYIKCMALTDNVPDSLFKMLSEENYKEINDYIGRKMTATVINERPGPPSREIITSEIIYYWLIAQQIPFDVQYWHLNNLLTLVRVVSIKNAPKQKMSRRDAARQQRSLNEQRLAQYGTSG